jgi:hypothetical protein
MVPVLPHGFCNVSNELKTFTNKSTFSEPPQPPPKPPPPPKDLLTQIVVTEECLITDEVELVQTGRIPVFVQPVPETVTLTQAHNELRVAVELDASPPVNKVKWFVDGYDMEMVPTDTFESTQMGNSATLLLRKEIINELVTGAMITCQASNPIGAAVSEGRVERERTNILCMTWCNDYWQ